MSKSLEALEVIECILSNHQTMLEAKDKRFEYINIIKKDLERLEQLEKENEDLKVFVDAYANARDELLIRNEQLEKENLELKDKLNSEALDNWQLHCKYGKYKKAIEIIFKHLDLYITNEGRHCIALGCLCSETGINKEDYELLNEVSGE